MRIVLCGGFALALLASSPDPAIGQQPEWWGWALQEVETSREGARGVPMRAGSSARGGGGGPAFCRSGQGHPVFGRGWCQEKGFGLGRPDVRWEDRGWVDIIFGSPQSRRSGTIDRGGLVDVLGNVVYGRLADESRRAGGNDPLVGRWIRPGGPTAVLQIRAGSVPIAELSDVNGDGRVDVVLMPVR